jgi:phospho-N-acetylmuramoyl-pentapeptide-transferase
MLYHLLVPLSETDGALRVFNVFRYVSFRTAWALITALGFCYVLYPAFIRWMQQKKMEQIIREDGPQSHRLNKAGTPTMGGVPMIAGIALSALMWCRLDQPVVWMALIVTLGYGAIGFYDDWKKVMERSADGLSGRGKILGQLLIGGGVFGWGYAAGVVAPTVPLPFLKDVAINFGALWAGAPAALGWLYVAVAVFILVGASNAVNLTDGLDGLAIGPVMTSAATYGILAYIAGHTVFSEYLSVPHVPGASELTVLAMATIGAGLGFLWYNAYPAQIFMGDVGSLALGGLLASLALLTKHELLLALVGGIFVLEALSVIIQVTSFKTTGKRVFAMAPIHHHYEKQGWSEPKIIVRFWIISILLALVALSTLKMR